MIALHNKELMKKERTWLGIYVPRATQIVVPIQWDYAAWIPVTERFITALKAQKFATPVSGYSVIMTGVVSSLTAKALAARGVKATTKALPGPLQ